MEDIIGTAIEKYKPKKVLLMFSGGHDSLCSTHYAATYLKERNIDFTVYHGNTGIGIRQTREFVHNVCNKFKWNLFIGLPNNGETYEDIVRKHGFPGPGSHRYMYILLKERALRKYVTHVCKSRPHARENVLLITGIRASESKIRMGYKEHTKKEGSKVWCSPLFHWKEEDCKAYIDLHNLPKNPVKQKICISGECLCGAFTKKEEWFEIQHSFPEAANEIKRLHKIACENGHPWEWASNPHEYQKQMRAERTSMHMCIGCEEKNYHDDSNVLNPAA